MGKAGPPSPGVQQPPFSATSVLQTQPGGSGRGVAAAGGFCGVSSAAAAAPGSASAKASAKAATVGARSGAARGMAGFEVDGGETAADLAVTWRRGRVGGVTLAIYALDWSCSPH
jgi:type IV secretory pathway TrbL component